MANSNSNRGSNLTTILLLLIIFLIVGGIAYYYQHSKSSSTSSAPNVIIVPTQGGPHIVGGCAGTRYGCCPNGRTARADAQGSNC